MAESQTFVFADLAGFTGLNEAHGDEEALEILQRFTAQVRSLLAEYDAEEIKTIGDEVMIRCSDPGKAVRLGVRIVEELAEHRAPPVRVGIHSGPAIGVAGDWFGATVNLASRVAGAARAGEALLTEQTAAQLPADPGVELQRRGTRYFKHVPQAVGVYRASTGPEPDYAIDPVCRMAVDRSRAADTVTHAGDRYYLCSQDCAEKFAAHPKRFIAYSPAARAARANFKGHLRVFLVAQSIVLVAWVASWALGGPGTPWFLFVLVPWGLGLVLHYRAVRKVL